MISKLFLILTDIVWLIVLFYIVLLVRTNIYEYGFPELDDVILYDFSFVFVILLILFAYEKIYTYRFDFWQESFKLIRSFFIGLLITFSLLALAKINLHYSRSFLLLYFALGIVLMPLFKRYTKKLLFKISYCQESVKILGKEEEKKIFEKELKYNWYLGQKTVLSGGTNVVIISKGLKKDELDKMIEDSLQTYKNIFLIPYITDINFAHSDILEYSNIRLNTIQVENKLLIKHNIWIKNSFDFLLSLLLILPFLVIHLVISIFIRLGSSGPIIFTQHRLGKDDIDFKVYKYRTMYTDGDEILQEYLLNNPQEIEYYQEYHKYKNDPRITKVGKLLRKTSLDEFPQLFNVLKGDMSLVGPRPYMLSESKKLDENKKFILRVKPGITGLWQVSGRNKLTFIERNRLEVWYIKNWSLWADIVILIKTVKTVFYKVGVS